MHSNLTKKRPRIIFNSPLPKSKKLFISDGEKHYFCVCAWKWFRISQVHCKSIYSVVSKMWKNFLNKYSYNQHNNLLITITVTRTEIDWRQPIDYWVNQLAILVSIASNFHVSNFATRWGGSISGGGGPNREPIY